MKHISVLIAAVAAISLGACSNDKKSSSPAPAPVPAKPTIEDKTADHNPDACPVFNGTYTEGNEGRTIQFSKMRSVNYFITVNGENFISVNGKPQVDSSGTLGVAWCSSGKILFEWIDDDKKVTATIVKTRSGDCLTLVTDEDGTEETYYRHP